ncbi:molybdenum cofactor guanylyltransferase MobA [Paraburkholderia bonniea]|uniref:molybdenum cofactor guanylyltransferase MobA n=1 Tax=Paraburkholderia bonniea TaxID=2152891 RepID=UPI001FE8E3A1|nr:molybdenum cofactor guanylyltransferase MobA [Paraburkholderia bonniea]WJF91429.1 molybdenum cofactor guanylyltransferase MobA [Paraburkholderia bonniea]WJF94747.1 molybdenum cofactor guanylyltransferase MobA [Paraburkholderia bonniea]
MGGVDKGLQQLHGEPLAAHVLQRLKPQAHALIINANRHLELYQALGTTYGASVVSDTLTGFPGPLAGLLAGMRAATTPFVLCAPCDTPFLPATLVSYLSHALETAHADIATAVTHDLDGRASLHPVVALVRTSLADDLAAFLATDQRQVRAWYARHTLAQAVFADEAAFYNANSLQDLALIERS